MSSSQLAVDPTAEMMFKVANRVALPCWLLLAIAPAHAYTGLIVKLGILAVCVCYVFSLFFGRRAGPPNPDANFSPLNGVIAIFQRSNSLVHNACWYVARVVMRGLPVQSAAPAPP